MTVARGRGWTTNDLCMPSFRTGFENCYLLHEHCGHGRRCFCCTIRTKSPSFLLLLLHLCVPLSSSVLLLMSVITHCLQFFFLSYLCILIYSFIYQPFSLHTQPHIYGFAFDDALIQRHSFPCVARACVHTLLRFSQVFQSTSTSFRFLGFAV